MGMQDIIGMTVRDEITGFTGVVTGRVEYITGCNQLLVAPKVSDSGEHKESHWLDEERCKVVPGARPRVVLPATVTEKNPGFDKQAPKRG